MRPFLARHWELALVMTLTRPRFWTRMSRVVGPVSLRVILLFPGSRPTKVSPTALPLTVLDVLDSCVASLLLRAWSAVAGGGHWWKRGAEHSVELSDQLEPSAERRLPPAIAHLAVDLVLGETRVDGDMQHLVSHRRQSAAATNPRQRGRPPDVPPGIGGGAVARAANGLVRWERESVRTTRAEPPTGRHDRRVMPNQPLDLRRSPC